MNVYEVGKPYNPHRKTWPDGSQFNFRGGEAELLLTLTSPTAGEVEGVKVGACAFALFVEPPLIQICYSFKGAFTWSEAPFSWHRMVACVPSSEAILPLAPEQLAPESRDLLRVILIDGKTGIVKALRVVTLSPSFTVALHRAIREQATGPYNDVAYLAALSRLYQRFRDARELVARAVARTPGGA